MNEREGGRNQEEIGEKGVPGSSADRIESPRGYEPPGIDRCSGETLETIARIGEDVPFGWR